MSVAVAVALACVVALSPATSAHAGTYDTPKPNVVVAGVEAVLTREGLLCVQREGGTLPSGLTHTLSGNVVIGPLCVIQECERTLDGNFVLRGGGHTVIVRDGSPDAVIDGKRLRLEAGFKVEQSPISHLRGPLNTLTPLLGSELKFGRLRRSVDQGFWLMRWPRGQPVPEQILTARRVLVGGTSWLLLLGSPHGGHDGGCGRLARTSGALVVSPDGPWAKPRSLATELEWRVRWDASKRAGLISFRGRNVSVRLPEDQVIVEGKGVQHYTIPPRLVKRLRAGELFIPIGPVARELGMRYWQSDPYMRVSGLSP